MSMSRHFKSVMKARRAGILAFALLLAAIPASTVAAETWVSFSLDFKFDGPSAPFVLALDKGYYKAEGLNVSIDEATGSLETIARVAAGT